MKINHFKIIKLLLGIFLFVSSSANAALMTPISMTKCCLPPLEIANQLGWRPTNTNLCRGYFHEPAIISACPNPPDIDNTVTTITAEETVAFSAVGTSSLSGHVTVTQPGRLMTADKALLYRDPETKNITQITLEGNVHFMEAGKHLVAQRIFVDLKNNYARLECGLYRLAKRNNCELNAWGTAACVERKGDHILELHRATYTTCPPTRDKAWQVRANHIKIDREVGRGAAYNTFLYLKNIPVIWVPYFTFPTDNRRKTGFLFPTLGYSNEQGLNISFPYYFNLAPNYDATIAPNYLYRRGLILIESNFRYLTCHSIGNSHLEFIPYDRLFARFRSTAAQVYGVNDNTILFLNRIQNEHDWRGLISFEDQTHFNPNTWGSLKLYYVTDDYYFQDFAANPFRSSQDQFLNQAEINYASDNWRFMGKLQTYQTLHPINQQPILDQYSRLPQLYISSDFPTPPNRFNFQINSELVYFDHRKNFENHTPITTGERFHLQPIFSYPFICPSSYFIPKLQIDLTSYSLQDQMPDQPSNVNRVLPIFDIDWGYYLQRRWGCYDQTLEPRFFYLYVPEKNQNDIPIFDTTLPTFSFLQLFRTNRFIGYDRVGDANQISLALTSRFLNHETGEQRFKISAGQIFYFHQPQVCLTPNCSNQPQTDSNFSPLIAQMSYHFNDFWEAVASMAYDYDDSTLNNASIQLHYRPSCKHIFNLGYDFVHKGDILTAYALNSSENNLSRINIAFAWQINDHWMALGNWNQNLSHGHPEAYFYGLQYDSCCWAMRIVASRILIAENINATATFQTNYYIQFQLKGLGNIGNSDPGSLLTTSIFGYHDSFRGLQ